MFQGPRHHHGPPHCGRRRCGPGPNFPLHKKMMRMSLEENQKRAQRDNVGQQKEEEETGTRVFMAPQQIHLQETETEAKLLIDVAGFSPKDLNVQVKRHVLIIEGKRQNRLGDVFVLRRAVSLDEFDTAYDEERIAANYGEGDVLEITIPKKTVRASIQAIPIIQVEADTSVTSDFNEGKKETEVLPEAEIVFKPSADTDTIEAPLFPSHEEEESVQVETVVEENEDQEDSSWEDVSSTK